MRRPAITRTARDRAQLDAFGRPAVPARPRATAGRPFRVSELPVHARPAARLTTAGAAALSLEELLTLALGCRTAGPARALADAYAGSLRTLAADTPAGVARAGRLPHARVARLHAALELGRRLTLEQRDDGVPVRSPADVFALYRVRLQDLPVEEFHVCALDAQHRVTRDILVTRGILNSSLCHPREVFREVIAERAAAVILVHNHPSGDPTPSPDDRAVTDQMVAAGRLLDIPVHDHVIVGRGRYASFAESGLL
jgi:DNA repair protein RadC